MMRTFDVYQVVCGYKFKIGTIDAHTKEEAQDIISINPVPMVVQEQKPND